MTNLWMIRSCWAYQSALQTSHLSLPARLVIPNCDPDSSSKFAIYTGTELKQAIDALRMVRPSLDVTKHDFG